MTTSRSLLLGIAATMLALMAGNVFAAKTCYDCHQKQKELYSSRKVIHQPVKEENCETCHKRHGFAQTLVLQNVTNDLCYACHADMKESFGKTNGTELLTIGQSELHGKPFWYRFPVFQDTFPGPIQR